jgi:spore coat polysaccharide biosynthesis protein SpsF
MGHERYDQVMNGTVAIIQARMGSTRLPGKAMLSLNCTPVIRHVVRRVQSATSVEQVVVATSQKERDEIIVRCGSKDGAEVVCGDEDDVLNRMYTAADKYGAGTVVRITADNPLLSPSTIDAAVTNLEERGVDYVTNKLNRTFPSGLDVEAFTFDSFREVEEEAKDPYYREHVTPYYRDSDQFSVLNIESDEVFDDNRLWNRTDLRLTLDTPDDYELFKRVYENVAYDEIVNIGDVIEYIDRNNLGSLNTG